ncbi:MAG TPA: DUF998 domain-containing protein [Blastococcus sp.]|nr:DUF998 domain-containing protein [Blastococcus sp.]
MTPNRLRAGACAWLLTLQFFVVEAVVAARAPSGYSRTANTISDLGRTTSPDHRLMNASFLLQAVLIVAGAALLRHALRGRAARVAPPLLGLAAAGVLIVGVFPSDGYKVVHATGAVLYLAAGGIGLIALAYGVRPRSELLGSTLALLGLVGTAMTVFFVSAVTQLLGVGGTERAAAYMLPLGLAVTGAALWRMGAGEAGAAETDGPSLRELRKLARDQERARQAEQQRQRDEALADRAAGTTPPGEGDDGIDDDPWATPGRRRD